MSITIKYLVELGILKNGDELYWKRNVRKTSHYATIENGLIKTEDGLSHKSPSGAARHLNNGKPIDGWKCWRLKSSGQLIDLLRSKE